MMGTKEEENNQEELEQNEEEQETLHNVEDLEKQKLVKSEQNIEGNTGYIQIFIQNLETLMGTWDNGYKQSEKQVHSKQPVKSYDLGNQDQCVEFVEKYGDSEYLIITIVLCTFGVVNISDLSELRQSLMEKLLHARLRSGNAEDNSFTSSYLSLNAILNVIGGEYFVKENGQRGVGIPWDEKTLGYILEQFPILKDPVISWLLQIHTTCKNHMRFDVRQIAVAFGRIILIDFRDAQRTIFPNLYTNAGNAELLATLALQLYEQGKLEEEIKKMVYSWLYTEQKWLWRPACLFICGLAERNNTIFFRQELKDTIIRRVMSFTKSDRQFTAMLLRQSQYFRTLFADVLSYVLAKEKMREKRLKVAELYLSLIQRGYYLVNAAFVELPLVACDTLQQLEYLENIVGQIMNKFQLRKRLYIILQAYLKEVSSYNLSPKATDHICAYFYLMASSDEDDKKEVLGFLKDLKNNTANNIYQRLCRSYEQKGEV